MKYLKILGLAAVAAMALMAVGAGSASATTLSVKGAKQTSSITIAASLKAGTTATLVDEFGSTTDTCNESTTHGTTTSPFTAAGNGEIDGNLSPLTNTPQGLTFSKCSHTTTVIKPGKLIIGWIKGTTNGTVTSAEAEVTVQSTVFGASAICKTGIGTDIGKITGVASGQATMDIEAINNLNCGILGNSSWTGTYVVTTPEGLGVEE
jgi:hypothetical protein